MGYKIKRILVGTQQVRPSVPATAISLNKSSISLTTVGQTSQLTATLTPSGSTSTVSWSSSNTSIATVSSSGLVTCVTPGSCTITATTNNGLTASCSVNGYIYSYGYDFRNKNATTLANDGWINVLGTASNFTYSSDGIYNSGSPVENVMIKIEGISSVIANAKKITLNMVGKSSYGQVSLAFREVATSSSRTGTTGIYFQRGDNYGNPCAIYWFIYGTSGNQTVSASTYENTWFGQTGVFDFVNKTLTITDTLGFSKVVTLTDTQISNIKTKMTCFAMTLGRTASMQSISVKIE